MKRNFRNDARLALQRARKELDSGTAERITYAALELRMAMEAITYDRAQAFKAEIPPKEYETWQPRKLMQLLLEIDPNADQNSTLSVGVEKEPGKPAEKMQSLGTEEVLNLSILKAHYDALGAYLHMPTLKQCEDGTHPDLNKLRDRCDAIAKVVDKVLSSPVFNVTLGIFATLDCIRCKGKIRKRIPFGKSAVNAACFNCGAEYKIQDEGPGKSYWEPIQEEVKCPTTNCGAANWLWRSDIKFGTSWKCHACGQSYIIGLTIIKDDRQSVNSSLMLHVNPKVIATLPSRPNRTQNAFVPRGVPLGG